MGRTFTDADFAPTAAVPASKPRVFSDDDFSVETPAAETAPASAAPEVGYTESALRGAKQGATLGFGDEIVGLGKALFSHEGLMGDSHDFKNVYTKARDEERAADHAAREANPWTYGAGNVGGSIASSFVPGLGFAKGAGVLKTALGAAKLGALGGLGESEATDAGEMARDAAVSGAISGATGGLMAKFLGGAPERVVKATLGDITDGATATMRDRVVGAAGKRVPGVMEVVGEKPFRAAGRDAGKLLEATEGALTETGRQLDKAYAAAGAKTPGVRVADVLGEVEQIAKRLKADPGKADLARAVESKALDVLDAWGNQTHVPAAQVRVLASDIADAAFRGSPAVSPKAGQGVAQEVWGSLKDLINKNVEEAGKGGSVELAALNKRMSTLMNIREAVRYRATRESTQSTRARDVIGGGVDMALAATSLPSFAAKKAIQHVGIPAARKMDTYIAQLVTSAQNGSRKAQIAQQALGYGLSPVVANALASWAEKQAGELNLGQ